MKKKTDPIQHTRLVDDHNLYLLGKLLDKEK